MLYREQNIAYRINPRLQGEKGVCGWTSARLCTRLWRNTLNQFSYTHSTHVYPADNSADERIKILKNPAMTKNEHKKHCSETQVLIHFSTAMLTL